MRKARRSSIFFTGLQEVNNGKGKVVQSTWREKLAPIKKPPYRPEYARARNFLSALSRTSCTCILCSLLIFLSSIFPSLSLRPCDNTWKKEKEEADKEEEKKNCSTFFYLSRFESKAISFEDVIVGMIDNLFLFFFFFFCSRDLASPWREDL